jgi:hypothetical protein
MRPPAALIYLPLLGWGPPLMIKNARYIPLNHPPSSPHFAPDLRRGASNSKGANATVSPYLYLVAKRNTFHPILSYPSTPCISTEMTPDQHAAAEEGARILLSADKGINFGSYILGTCPLTKLSGLAKCRRIMDRRRSLRSDDPAIDPLVHVHHK